MSDREEVPQKIKLHLTIGENTMQPFNTMIWMHICWQSNVI